MVTTPKGRGARIAWAAKLCEDAEAVAILLGVKERYEASSFTGETWEEGMELLLPLPIGLVFPSVFLLPAWCSLWERLGITSTGHLSFLGNPSGLQMPVSGGSTRAEVTICCLVPPLA